jgi:hypothetical protein
MRIIDFLTFKSPKRVDWNETERKLIEYINKQEGSPVEKALWAADMMEKIKTLVKVHGVSTSYKAIHEDNKPDS